MKTLTTLLKRLMRATTVAAVALLYMPGLQAAPGAGLATVAGEGVQGKHEKHPHIRAAIHELRETVRELKEAAHDFGGHRVEAIQASENAIEQLRTCMESGKKAGAANATHPKAAAGGAVTPKSGQGKAEVTATAKTGQGENEQHPHIHAALRELHEAARELKEAAHDFGGHREEALKATDNAMAQLRKALEFDKK